MNMQGEIVNIYELAELGEIGKLWDARFLNDSLLAASASWGDPDFNSPMAVIIDTLGNIKKESFLLDNSYMSYVRPTYDRKILFYTEDFNPQTEDFSVSLFKLNQNLEDDTIYTRPFTYDSLCPYQIVSDTIVPYDCGLIVGVEEPGGGEAGKQGGMEIWPNPARDQLHVRLNMDSLSASWRNGRLNSNLTLVIYDIFGREVQTEMISSTREGGGREGGWNWQINVESFPPGVYIVILKDGLNIFESRKFVMVR